MFAEKYTYEETTILTQVQQLQLKAIGKVLSRSRLEEVIWKRERRKREGRRAATS